MRHRKRYRERDFGKTHEDGVRERVYVGDRERERGRERERVRERERERGREKERVRMSTPGVSEQARSEIPSTMSSTV
jgi:hypothetical protein